MTALDRRGFLSAVVALPVTLAITPLIGEVAGGLYVPAPADLESYVRFTGYSQPASQRVQMLRAYAMVAWAPLGAKVATVQMWAGCSIVSETATAADMAGDRTRLLASMRAQWAEDHYPGWLRIVENRPTGTFDEDGYPESESVRKWVRVGYLRWLDPNARISPEIAVA